MRFLKYIWIVNAITILGWLFYLFIFPSIYYKEELIIPNLTGYTEADAIRLLNDSNINADIYYIESDISEVKYSIPSFGSTIKKNATISLYIGRISPIYYESFVGLMYDKNQDYISQYCKENKITYTVVYELNDDEIPGLIINQSKTALDEVCTGDEIILTVSSSNQYVQMPSLSGMHIDSVISFLNENNLKARTNDSALIIYYADAGEELWDIARKYNKITKFGTVADPFADKLTLLTVLFSLYIKLLLLLLFYQIIFFLFFSVFFFFCSSYSANIFSTSSINLL